MLTRSVTVLLCLAVWVAADYIYEDEQIVELYARLTGCLAGLPSLGPSIPADACRFEGVDLLWEEASKEEAIPAVANCLLDYYKHDPSVTRDSIDCLHAELSKDV